MKQTEPMHATDKARKPESKLQNYMLLRKQKNKQANCKISCNQECKKSSKQKVRMQANKKARKQTRKLQGCFELRNPNASKQTAGMLSSREGRREGGKVQENKQLSQ